MEKVALKVNVKATDGGCEFVNSNTGEVLGSVHTSHDYKGRYFVKFCGELCRNGETYTDAVEYISDRIESVFALVGIDVEFVTMEG